MKLSCHGADQQVTGSCHPVECAGVTIDNCFPASSVVAGAPYSVTQRSIRILYQVPKAIFSF